MNYLSKLILLAEQFNCDDLGCSTQILMVNTQKLSFLNKFPELMDYLAREQFSPSSMPKTVLIIKTINFQIKFTFYTQMNLRLLLIVLCCTFSVTLAANCTFTIQDYITYLTTSDPGYNRYVSFKMSSIKGDARYVGYSQGNVAVSFTIARFGLRFPYLYSKDATTVFSDRTWCPEQDPADLFCFGYQKFDYKKYDKFTLSLYTDSTARIVLTTWGNAAYSYPLECKDGFLYGTLKESNGNSFISISLKKERYGIPK